MNPETAFVLDALADVAVQQPSEHPLRRVDRDNSLVLETEQMLDFSAPVDARKEDLQKANFVGVAYQSRDNDPIGTNYNHETDVVLSVRVEALTSRDGQYGHVDPFGKGSYPTFSELYEAIRSALLDRRKYPDDHRFNDAKLDLRVANEDDQSSDWQHFYRREFDLILRGRESLS